MLLWVTDGRRDTQTHTHIYTEPVSASVCVCVIRHPVSHLFLSVSSPPRDAFFWNYAHEKLIEVGWFPTCCCERQRVAAVSLTDSVKISCCDVFSGRFFLPRIVCFLQTTTDGGIMKCKDLAWMKLDYFSFLCSSVHRCVQSIYPRHWVKIQKCYLFCGGSFVTCLFLQKQSVVGCATVPVQPVPSRSLKYSQHLQKRVVLLP